MAATPASGGGADPRVDGGPRRLPRPPPPAARGPRRQLLQGPPRFPPWISGGPPTDWRALFAALSVSVLRGWVRAGQDVGAAGRRVDGVPPAGARRELAQAAIRMRPGMHYSASTTALLLHAPLELMDPYLLLCRSTGPLRCESSCLLLGRLLFHGRGRLRSRWVSFPEFIRLTGYSLLVVP